MDIKKYERGYAKLKPFVKEHLEGFWKKFAEETQNPETIEVTEDMVEGIIEGLFEANKTVLIDFFDSLGIYITIENKGGRADTFLSRIVMAETPKESKSIVGQEFSLGTRSMAEYNGIEAAFKYYEANGNAST